ncbi:MAG: polyamine aminopropyltransferase [bacterium]|nr:polyamine aminopropyltransferase [bacterium]
MPKKKQKWFCEGTVPGQRLGTMQHCFAIQKLLYRGKTKYQSVLIFDNPVFKRVLVLEGIVQLSQADESIYHEMLVHPTMFSHKSPERVLIIGGGDGGTLREVLRHPVKEAVMVDIDKKVVDLCVRYLPFMKGKKSYGDRRTKLVIGDGLEFVKKYKDYFDVVIIDGNDEVGAATELYGQAFYRDVKRALKADGMVAAQIGSLSLDYAALVKRAHTRFQKLFLHTQTFKLTMPSYHCGEYAFVAASKKTDFQKVSWPSVKRRFGTIARKHAFRYYSPEIHASSMVLPEMWKAGR